MTTHPSTDRSPHVPQPHPDSDDLEYEELEVYVDEIRVGDIYGGLVVSAVHMSEHYRSPARRLTVFTDPEMLPPGVQPQECGRIVLTTDRATGHKVPVLRPVLT